MSDEPLTRAVLASTLAEFHRAIVLPDIQRIVGEIVGEFRREVNGHFDDIYRRFERLETEYGSLKAGLARVEERLDRVDGRLDRLEQGQRELRAAVNRLEERLGRLERQVHELAAAEEKHALRSDVQDLKARVDVLHDDIRRLEQRLQA